VPPAAAKRLKQQCGITEASGLCLRKIEQGLSVALFGGDQCQSIQIAVGVLATDEIQCRFRGLCGIVIGFQ